MAVVSFLGYKSSTWSQEGSFQSQLVTFSSQEKPINIAVATDLHYLSSSLTDGGSFFTDLVNNADGKNMFYIEEITESFVATIIREKPEILILSGDLTFNGERQSHLDLEKKLSRIRQNGTQILVIPGNHDIDRSSAAGFYGDGYELVDSINKEEFAKIYQDYGLQESIEKDDTSLSYLYRARKDFWILMLDSNSHGTNEISDQTFSWIEEILKDAKEQDIQVLAVSHQNLLAHNPYFTEGFLIHRAQELEAFYEKYDVLANLSGHIHIQHIEDGGLPEILTSALPVSPHHYGILEFDGKTLDYQAKILDVASWAREQGLTDQNLLDFSQTSRAFMEQVSARKLESELLDSQLTSLEGELLLQTFAQLNTDYFAGRQIDPANHQQGLSLMQESDLSFYPTYIDSILKSAEKGHESFQLELE